MRGPSVSPRPHIPAIEPCYHGSISQAELRSLGLSRREVLDFSASTNPLGPSPAVAAAISALSPDDIGRYPDDGTPELRAALADHLGLPANQISIGNGSAEIFWLLALAYLAPGDAVLVVGPTFGEYARAARVAGATVVEYRARPEDGFIPNPDELVALARAHGIRMVFLCNPNNPTGVLLDHGELQTMQSGIPDALLVIDEAYASLADDAPHLEVALANNLVLVRSLTKDGGLAGLRVGYALAAEEIIAHLHRVRPPWNVNIVAQRAALAALADRAHLERSRAEVRRARGYLVSALAALGIEPVADSANFLLIDVGDGAALRATLLHRGVCVRDCASFGLPAYIRIGIRRQEECAVLIAALREELNGA